MGSEMCIRDRARPTPRGRPRRPIPMRDRRRRARRRRSQGGRKEFLGGFRGRISLFTKIIRTKVVNISENNYLCTAKPTEGLHHTPSGCSSARLEYTSGGRVVASSNLVTPTNRESLIFSRISRIFLLCRMVRKMAVVHKWDINGRYPKISILAIKYLVVG